MSRVVQNLANGSQAAGAAVPAGADADAVLHALCAKAADIKRRYSVKVSEKVATNLTNRKWAGAAKAWEITPRTPEGLLAKAAVLLHLWEGNHCWSDGRLYEEEAACLETRFTITTLRDIVRGPVALPESE